MGAVALCYDIFEIALDGLGTALLALAGVGIVFYIVGVFATAFISLTFWLWFRLQGVPVFGSPKKVAMSSATFLLESIPGLDSALIITTFGWTIGVITLIVMTRSEDKGGTLGKTLSAKNRHVRKST